MKNQQSINVNDTDIIIENIERKKNSEYPSGESVIYNNTICIEVLPYVVNITDICGSTAIFNRKEFTQIAEAYIKYFKYQNLKMVK